MLLELTKASSLLHLSEYKAIRQPAATVFYLTGAAVDLESLYILQAERFLNNSLISPMTMGL